MPVHGRTEVTYSEVALGVVGLHDDLHLLLLLDLLGKTLLLGDGPSEGLLLASRKFIGQRLLLIQVCRGILGYSVVERRKR